MEECILKEFMDFLKEKGYRPKNGSTPYFNQVYGTKDGTLVSVLNEKDGIFSVDISIPFKSKEKALDFLKSRKEI